MLSRMHSFNISKPFMLGSLFFALIIHSSIIPISSFITINKNQEIEPNLVLELLNNIDMLEPINPIEKLDISKNIELTKPKQIEPLIRPEIVEETITNNINIKNEEINVKQPSQLQNIEKINKPDNIVKNINDIPLVTQRPEIIENQIKNEIIKPNQLNITPNITLPDNKITLTEPSKKIDRPDQIIKKQLPIITSNKTLQNISNEIDINLNSIPKQTINKINKTIKPIFSNTNELTKEEINALEEYKNSIRSTIQSFAIANYPKKLQRRRIQGVVQLIFQLNNDGSILNVSHGPNTEASQELIDAAIKALNNSAPFESNDILKENNEFSIDIIYKIQ